MDDLVIDSIDLAPPIAIRNLPAFERQLQPTVREMPLLDAPPWIRTLGKLTIDVTTQGWRFPSPDDVRGEGREARDEQSSPRAPRPSPLSRTRVKPPSDMVIFKDRLL